MGQPKITEIKEMLGEWGFLSDLPKEINGFVLENRNKIDGQILQIVSYVSSRTKCSIDLIYTGETFDYVPVKNIGLHSFRDDRFFCRDKDKFADLMLKNLPKIIADIDRDSKHEFSYEAAAQNFEKWEYWRSLPKKIEGYELFITPENPVRYINGSILFLDYTDFDKGNQIYFLYNIFRDEIFAELKKEHIPCTTEVFDAKNLTELEAKLQTHLSEFIKNI